MKKLRNKIMQSLMQAEFALDDMCADMERSGADFSVIEDYYEEITILREKLEVELKKVCK